MNKNTKVFLKHILESIDAIEEYAQDISEKAFLENQEKQDAIIRRLEVLGEAAKNLPDEFKKQHSNIAWNKAMATRNILIHHYFGIDLKIVWDTITGSLPEFKNQVKNLLEVLER